MCPVGIWIHPYLAITPIKSMSKSFWFQVQTIMVKIGVTSAVVGTVVGVTALLSALATEHCKVFSISNSYSGRYCPGDGMVTLHILPHQCRYVCLASPTCNAYSYNTTKGQCIRFASPCLQAIPDTVMEFALFTEKTMDQCYKWVPYSPRDTVDPRMLSTDDAHRIICRMEKDGMTECAFFIYHNQHVMPSGNPQNSTTTNVIPVSTCASWRTVSSSGFLTSLDIL